MSEAKQEPSAPPAIRHKISRSGLAGLIIGLAIMLISTAMIVQNPDSPTMINLELFFIVVGGVTAISALRAMETTPNRGSGWCNDGFSLPTSMQKRANEEDEKQRRRETGEAD